MGRWRYLGEEGGVSFGLLSFVASCVLFGDVGGVARVAGSLELAFGAQREGVGGAGVAHETTAPPALDSRWMIGWMGIDSSHHKSISLSPSLSINPPTQPHTHPPTQYVHGGGGASRRSPPHRPCTSARRSPIRRGTGGRRPDSKRGRPLPARDYCCRCGRPSFGCLGVGGWVEVQ